jgi:hAT family C-terminal dimerisation region
VKIFSALSEAALGFLAIPASQGAFERNISTAENAQSSRSSCMLPRTLNDILFLRSKGKEC